MMGFAVIVGSTTFNSAGPFTYPVPKGFRTITATVTNGTPGTTGFPINCCTSPGGPGGASSFNGAGTATYQRSASAIQPRQVIAGVVGAGGAGVPSPYIPAYGPPTAPGTPGSVVVSVA